MANLWDRFQPAGPCIAPPIALAMCYHPAYPALDRGTLVVNISYTLRARNSSYSADQPSAERAPDAESD
jgi:hypothetical protein